jgi:hypothetical protein
MKWTELWFKLKVIEKLIGLGVLGVLLLAITILFILSIFDNKSKRR